MAKQFSKDQRQLLCHAVSFSTQRDILMNAMIVFCTLVLLQSGVNNAATYTLMLTRNSLMNYCYSLGRFLPLTWEAWSRSIQKRTRYCIDTHKYPADPLFSIWRDRRLLSNSEDKPPKRTKETCLLSSSSNSTTYKGWKTFLGIHISFTSNYCITQ